MPKKKDNPSNLWQEIKRRKVVRVITVYAAASFVLLELVDIITEPFELPDWTLRFVFVLLCIGFVIAVILSWVYDITPDGIQKTKPATQVRREKKQATPKGWKISTYISVFIIIAFVVFYIISNIKQSSDISKLEKTIAVLPFDNMSDDDEFVHLGDALTDEIIMQLYKIDAFTVRSRTSIMQYKNTEKTSPIIGEELKVNYLLEGSAQRYEDQVRIRIQLIHASTDDHIWGEVFEGNWNEIFDIQINVAKQVAHELKTVLSYKEVERIEKGPTENIEAYNLYLHGRYFWNKRTEEEMNKALKYFEQAIKEDSTYSLAYVGMADVYNMLATYCFLHPKEAHSKSKSLSLKALEFNEYLSEAYSSLAWAKMHLDLDWKGVESDFKRAISLNPNYATTYSWYSVLLVILGRINEAHEMIRKALELDPLSLPINNIAASHYYSGREYNKTIEYCKKTIEIDSNFHAVHYTLGNAYIQKKLFNEAIAEQQKALNLSGGSLEYLIALAYTYGFAGNKEEALKILNDILQSSKYEYVPLSRISLIYISLGEFNTAIKYLEKAFEEQDISWHFLFIKVDPMFDSLREDVRFKSLLKKVGLDN